MHMMTASQLDISQPLFQFRTLEPDGQFKTHHFEKGYTTRRFKLSHLEAVQGGSCSPSYSLLLTTLREATASIT